MNEEIGSSNSDKMLFQIPLAFYHINFLSEKSLIFHFDGKMVSFSKAHF